MAKEDIVDENVSRLVYTSADAANLTAIAVAAEREACVRLVWDTPTQADDEYVSHKETIAKAIRARGDA